MTELTTAAPGVSSRRGHSAGRGRGASCLTRGRAGHRWSLVPICAVPTPHRRAGGRCEGRCTMGWIKALAIGVAVVIVFSMISVILHLAYLAIVAIAIGAIVALVFKARARLRAGRAPKTRKIEAEQAQATLAPRPMR